MLKLKQHYWRSGTKWKDKKTPDTCSSIGGLKSRSFYLTVYGDMCLPCR